MYSGANIFFRKYVTRMGIEVSFVNMLDLDETEMSLKSNTTVVSIISLFPYKCVLKKQQAI